VARWMGYVRRCLKIASERLPTQPRSEAQSPLPGEDRLSCPSERATHSPMRICKGLSSMPCSVILNLPPSESCRGPKPQGRRRNIPRCLRHVSPPAKRSYVIGSNLPTNVTKPSNVPMQMYIEARQPLSIMA